MNRSIARLVAARRDPRGQTMVMFALTLMLLALMVCMTLSFSMRIREKIETQTVSDAAAYTNAVITARAYNHISMFNRVMVSHMVAQASAMSLVSWASQYRSGINLLTIFVLAMIGGTSADCSGWNICACLTLIPLAFDFLNLLGESGRIQGMWDPLDDAAGFGQHTGRSSVCLLMYIDEILQYKTKLEPGIGGQGMTNGNIIPGVQTASGEFNAPGGADSVNNREIDWGGLLGILNSKGAAAAWNPVNGHAVNAGMASRGWPFTTGRWDVMLYGNPLQQAFNNIGLSGNVTVQSAWGMAPFLLFPVGPLPWAGSGMWSPLQNAHSLLPIPGGFNTYGEDHHWLQYDSVPGCPDPSQLDFGFSSHVRASPLGMSEHQGWPGDFPLFFLPWSDTFPQVHDLTFLTTPIGIIPLPGTWPPFVDYNWTKVDDQTDNFGQPKNISVVTRDYALRPQPADPWNLLFNFTFDNSGGGQTFNNQGLQLVGPSFTGTNVSQQMALSTGIAYYHRYGGVGNSLWREPPNFLNPFWRATLVAPDTDKQGTPAVAGYPAPWCGGGPCPTPGGADPVTVMTGAGGASSAQWVDAYQRLANAGFKGFQ